MQKKLFLSFSRKSKKIGWGIISKVWDILPENFEKLLHTIRETKYVKIKKI